VGEVLSTLRVIDKLSDGELGLFGFMRIRGFAQEVDLIWTEP